MVTTAMSSRPDYLVATTLPWMQLVHEDESADRWKHFTVDEARQLYVDGLPLLINHNDGATDRRGFERPLYTVGEIKASAVVGPNAKILATIDPALSGEATYASNAVASGHYADVSLGHVVDVHVRSADENEDGIATYTKTPKEVSVCKKGARYGSSITEFCPGRATIERLSVDDLATMVERHRYKQVLADRGFADIATSDRSRYIDALVTASDERLAEAIEQQHLHPRPPPAYKPVPTMTSTTEAVKASDDATKQAATETPAAATTTEKTTPQQQPTEPAAAAAATTTEKTVAKEPEAAKEPARSVETPSLGNNGGHTQQQQQQDTPPHEWAKMAVQYKEESVKRAQELAEQRAALEQAKADLAEKTKAIDAINAKEEAKKAEEKAKKKEQLEQIIKSYLQYGARARMPKHELDEMVENARAVQEANPEASLKMMDSAMKLAVVASEQVAKNEAADAAKMQAITNHFNDQFFTNQARRIADLNATDVALQSAVYPPPSASTVVSSPPMTALSTRIEPATPSQETTPSAVVAQQQQIAVQSSASVPEPAAPLVPSRKRSLAEYVEPPTPTGYWKKGDEDKKLPLPREGLHFLVEASDDTFPVQDLSENVMKTIGKYPSMSMLAYGDHFEATGKVQMSATTGVEEPVIERKRLRRHTPARISPFNYAPGFAKTLLEQLESLPEQPRGGSAMRLTMVEKGPAVDKGPIT